MFRTANDSFAGVQSGNSGGEKGNQVGGGSLTLNTDMDVIFSGRITNVVGERICSRDVYG